MNIHSKTKVNTPSGFGLNISADAGNAQDQFCNLINTVKEYAIFMINPQGFIQTWNDGAKYIKGYDADEIIGQHMSVFYSKGDQQKMLPAKLLEHARVKGEARDEGWRVRKDGTRFWSDVVVTALLDHKKNITGFSKITRDLTRKHKQREFDKNNLYALLNNTRDLMWSVDRNYNFITSNHAFNKTIKKMAGQSVEKGGAILEAGFSKRQLKNYKKYYDRAFCGEIFTEIEYTSTPVENWTEISFYPIYEGDTVVGISCHAHDITSVKRVELELQSAYKKLVFHIENTPLGFIEWDDKLQIKSLSKRAEEIFGWTLEEFVEHGKTGLSQVYKDDQPLVFRIAEQLLSGTVEKNKVQHRNYTKDGRVIWCDWFNSVLKDNEGKVITIMSLVQDITERKENEEKLKESEIKLKEAQKMAHVGSWELNYSTAIATWSEEMLRIYGLSTEDNKHTYESWISFIHPKDVDRVTSIIKEAKATFSTPAFFHRIIRRDGTIRHLYCQAKTQFNSDGKPIGLYGVGHDVTEMKEAEELLLESQSNMQAIFENTYDGIILTDTKGILKFFNSKAKDLIFRNSGADIKIGKSILDFTEESRKENIKDIIARVLSGETIQRDRSYEKNGETRWFIFTKTPVYNGDNIVGICITSRDITARKEGEQSLLRSESNLKAIIENTDATIYSLDSNLRYITFNKRLQTTLKDIFGLDIKPGDHVFDFLEKLNPEESHSWKEQYSKALKGETVRFEKKFHINECYSYSDFSIHPIWEKDNVVGLSCFVLDITNQKQAEHALTKSEFRYRQIVETAQEGIWLIDENNETTFVNKKMCDILEYSHEEMLGKENFNFMNDAGKELAMQTLERRKKGIKGNVDLCFITKTGKNIWTNISASPIIDENGNYKGALGMVSDITEKKILQQQLSAEQMDKQKDITKAVVNAQEKERAEIGVELHDNINQLLAASKLYLGHSLTQTDHTPFVVQSQEYISTAMEEIRKLSHALIGPNHDKTLGLIDSLKELIKNISVVKKIRFTFSHSTYHEEEIEAGLKLVIYRIIQEQLNNVIKHAEASKVEIELKSEVDFLKVTINDDGKGFDTTAKRNGIGLNNIKNRADVYNGEVQILSSPGKGCNMQIIFKNKGY